MLRSNSPAIEISKCNFAWNKCARCNCTGWALNLRWGKEVLTVESDMGERMNSVHKNLVVVCHEISRVI